MASPVDRPASASVAFPPATRREIFGWCCFDFANSAYTTVIVTTLYGLFFANVVAQGDPRADAWWGWALGGSQIVVLLLSPWVGALVDLRASKKRALFLFASLCSVATALLALPGRGDVALALGLVALANLAFSLSENVCAGFLPEISTPETAGKISGYGWSFGYLGGLLSLVLAFLIAGGEMEGPRTPWAFVMTGGFFLLGALPTLFLLRERAVPRARSPGVSLWRESWTKVFAGLRELPQHRTLAWFLVAFLCFMTGLTAIIVFAARFGDEVLQLTLQETLFLFVGLQLASALGAFAFGFFQDKFGSKSALIAALLVWLVVSGWAGFCRTKTEFFIIAALSGIGIGSLQSASRALVAQLTPPGRGGEFFGFWGLFGKLGAVLGPVTMGTLASAFGFRAAALVNGVFFLAGLAVVLSLRLPRPAKS